jgi:hypothetical protein
MNALIRWLRMLNRAVFFALWLLLYISTRAQIALLPLNEQWQRPLLLKAWADDSVFIQGMQPFFTSGEEAWRLPLGDNPTESRARSLIGRKLFAESLLDIRGEDFRFTIDPLFEGSFGFDFSDSSAYGDTTRLFTNTRGVLVRGSIGQQLAFVSGFHETQSFFPLFLRNQAQGIGAVPGLGRFKSFRNANGFDYSMSFGELTYRPVKALTLRMGYGKNFIGHGYRSHVLSDAAFNYPYLAARIVFGKNKWSYTTLYASLQSLERLPRGEVPESLFKRKGASVHLLTYSPTPRLEIGLFERIIWQRWNSSGSAPIAKGTFAPLLFLHSALNGLNGKHPSAVGAQVAFRVMKKWQWYAQWSTTEFSADRSAWQAGMRFMELWRGVDIRLEYNTISAFYGNHTTSLQSASHFNQPLGSPVGGDSKEWIAQVDWTHRRWRASFKFNDIRRQLGPGAEWDSNPEDLFPSDLLATTQRVKQLDWSVGYVVNPASNAQLLLGQILRRADQTGTDASFVYLSFRTVLNRRYFDF